MYTPDSPDDDNERQAKSFGNGGYLELNTNKHVLVLHCRGMAGADNDEAYTSLLYMLMSMVEREQLIYLHVFRGNSSHCQGSGWSIS